MADPLIFILLLLQKPITFGQWASKFPLFKSEMKMLWAIGAQHLTHCRYVWYHSGKMNSHNRCCGPLFLASNIQSNENTQKMNDVCPNEFIHHGYLDYFVLNEAFGVVGTNVIFTFYYSFLFY
jgi:hypothetical protein